MALEIIEKHPAAREVHGPNFANRLPAGVTVVSATVSAEDLTTGAADTSVIASTTGTVSGDGLSVEVMLQNGVSGKRYKITFLCTLSDGELFPEELWMDVLAR